jgi:hypothetical protein
MLVAEAEALALVVQMLRVLAVLEVVVQVVLLAVVA